jgi:hypothetical protein
MRYIEPPIMRTMYMGRMASSVSTKFGYCSAPSALVARHIRPWVTPETHMAMT